MPGPKKHPRVGLTASARGASLQSQITKRRIPTYSSLDAAVLSASLFTPPADENILPHIKRNGTLEDKPQWIQACNVAQLAGPNAPCLSTQILEDARIDLELAPAASDHDIMEAISMEIIQRMCTDGLGAICNFSLGHNVATVMLTLSKFESQALRPVFSTNKPADQEMQNHVEDCRSFMLDLTKQASSLFPHHAPSFSDRVKQAGLWDTELNMAATVYGRCYRKVHHRFSKKDRGKVILDTISGDLNNGAVDIAVESSLKSIVEALTRAQDIITGHPVPKTGDNYQLPLPNTLKVLYEKLLVVSVLLRNKVVRSYMEGLGTRCELYLLCFQLHFGKYYTDANLVSQQLHRPTIYVLDKISSLSNSLNNLAFVACSPQWRRAVTQGRYGAAQWLPLPGQMRLFDGNISEKNDVTQWYKESVTRPGLPSDIAAWKAIQSRAKSWNGWTTHGFKNRDGAVGKHQIIQTSTEDPSIHCESVLIQWAIQHQKTMVTNRYIGCSKLSCHPCYTQIRAVNHGLSLTTYKDRFKVKGSHGKGYAPWTCAGVGTQEQDQDIRIHLVRYLWEDVGRMVGFKQLALSDSEPDDGAFGEKDEYSLGPTQ